MKHVTAVDFSKRGDFELVLTDEAGNSLIVNPSGFDERWAESSDFSVLARFTTKDCEIAKGRDHLPEWLKCLKEGWVSVF
jgi:hypothetical protein